MPPYNRASCDEENVGTFCQKSLSLDEDDQPKQGILSDLRVFTGLPRQVTFAVDQEHIHLIRGCGDYSTDEIQDCWYTGTDFLAFKQETLVTLEIYKTNPARVNDVEYTMRGLEHHREEVRKRRKLLRLVVRLIVLGDEDFSGGACESTSSDHVAKMYSLASSDSIRVALCRAAIDQSAAEVYQRETSSELFNDEWIRCISSTGKNVSYPPHHQQTWSKGVIAEEDVSGFDDSWLDAPSGTTIIYGCQNWDRRC